MFTKFNQSKSLFKNWYLIKHILPIEIKSFTRNKFQKLSILHSYLFIPLGLIILKDNRWESASLLIFWTCLLLATPVIGISSFSFCKDGFFYPGLVTRNIPMKVYVQGKILFILIYSIIFYLCLLPFMINVDILVLYSFGAGSIYYLGFGGMVMLYCSSFDKHKVDLNSGPFFNYEGFSVLKILLTLPVTSPLLFWEKARYWGLLIMFLFGIFGLLKLNFFINLIAQNLAKRKYSYLNLPANTSN